MSSEIAHQRDADELDRLVHAMRQPLSALLLLVDRAQRHDLPEGLRSTMVDIEHQVSEAVAISRQLSVTVERAASPPGGASGV